jgi:hypothetical protein
MSSAEKTARYVWFWVVILYCLSHIGLMPFIAFHTAGALASVQPIWGWFLLWAVVKVVFIGGFSWLAIYWAKSNVCLTLLIIYLFFEFIMRWLIIFATHAINFKETYNGLKVMYESSPMNTEKVLGLIFYCAVWLAVLVLSFCLYKINRKLKAAKKSK